MAVIPGRFRSNRSKAVSREYRPSAGDRDSVGRELPVSTPGIRSDPGNHVDKLIKPCIYRYGRSFQPSIMSFVSTQQWKSLEELSATAFLIAAAMFLVDAALVGGVIAGAGDRLMLLGQAFVAAGWIAGFVGLIGLYPELADRSRRSARAGLVFVAVGLVVFVVMGIASLVYFTGISSGDLAALVPIFLPGIVIGSVLGFLTFGATSLRSDVHSRSVGVLLVVLGLFPVANILSGLAGVQSEFGTLAIVLGLSLVNAAVGYRLRGERDSTERVGAGRPGEPAA